MAPLLFLVILYLHLYWIPNLHLAVRHE